MGQCIVVEHPSYAGVYRNGPWDDRTTLGLGRLWAESVDREADGFTTPPDDAENNGALRRPGGPHNRLSHCVIPRVASWRGATPEHRVQAGETVEANRRRRRRIDAPICAVALSTYQRAAAWAGRGGTVSILVGHGDALMVPSGPESREVTIAPGEAALLNSGALALALRRGRERGVRDLAGLVAETNDPAVELAIRMGEAFRRRHLSRVDLLVCRTGVGDGSRAFLANLATIWGCRVRGVRGTSNYGEGWWAITEVTPPTRRPLEQLRIREVREGNLTVPIYASPLDPVPYLETGRLLGSHRGVLAHLALEFDCLRDSASFYPPDAMFLDSGPPGRL